MQRGYTKRSKKKKTKTEVVIYNCKLNIKVLSSCRAALLCNSLLSILALGWKSCISESAHRSPVLLMLNYKHFCDFSSGPFLSGYYLAVLFGPFSPRNTRLLAMVCRSLSQRPPLRFLANLRCGQELLTWL